MLYLLFLVAFAWANVDENTLGEDETGCGENCPPKDSHDFDPKRDLHNEDYAKWLAGLPYDMIHGGTQGYVCEEFKLPINEGTALSNRGLRDVLNLDDCKMACSIESKNGCNAFAYLETEGSKDCNTTKNECHLKEHFAITAEWSKTVSPWVFCIRDMSHTSENPDKVEGEDSIYPREEKSVAAAVMSTMNSPETWLYASGFVLILAALTLYIRGKHLGRASYVLMEHIDEV